MTYEIKISTAAKGDIKRIVKYVLANFGREKAEEVYDELHAEINKLAHHPEKGAHIPALEELGIIKYRLLVLPPHNKIIYVKNDKTKIIKIRVVLGSRQSFQKVLFDRILSKNTSSTDAPKK